MKRSQVLKIKSAYLSILQVYSSYQKRVDNCSYMSSYDILDFKRLSTIVESLEDIIIDNE